MNVFAAFTRALPVWRNDTYDILLCRQESSVGDQVARLSVGIFRMYETSCAVKAADTSCALPRELLFSQHRCTERRETPRVDILLSPSPPASLPWGCVSEPGRRHALVESVDVGRDALERDSRKYMRGVWLTLTWTTETRRPLTPTIRPSLNNPSDPAGGHRISPRKSAYLDFCVKFEKSDVR